MNIKISANVRSAVRGMKKVRKESEKTGKDMKKLALAAAAVATAYKAMDAGIQMTVGTFKKAGSELAVLGDRMAKQARMVGVTAEQYQIFEFAAERSGTSITAVSNGLKKLGRVMLDARNGSRQIKETFEALGIELVKSDGTLRDVNDVFLDLSDRFAAMGPSAERTGSMMLLLGRSGTEMANMMAGGRKGITDMKGVLDELGSVMGEDLLDNSELFVDAQADLKFAARGLAIEVGTKLMPAMTGAMQGITEFIVSLDGERIGAFMVRLVNLAETFLHVAESVLGLNSVAGRFSNTLVGDLRQVETQISSTEDRISELTTAIAGVESGFIKKNLEAVGLYDKSIKNQAEALEVLNFALKEANLNLTTQEKAYAALREEQRQKGEQDKQEQIDGQRLKQLLTDLANSRKKNNKAIKGSTLEKRLSALASRDLIASMKAESKALQEYLGYVNDLRGDLKSLFAEDLGRLGSLFSAGIVGEAEFLDRSTAEIRRAAQEQYDIRVAKAKENFEVTKQTAEDEIFYYGKVADARQMMERDIQLGMAETNAALAQSREEQAVLEREQFERQLGTAAALTSSIGSLFSSLSQIAAQAYERGDEEAKRHAIALFHISQAFALATATVNTALSVSQALATPPAPNIPLGVAAGIAGAAEIATIIGTSIAGIGDAGLTSDMMKRAGLNNHSAIVMRNDETLLDPVGTKHITEMLAIQKAQMQNGGGAQTIRTTVELDGRVLGESVDNYLIRQQERGLAYGNRVRQEYV